MLLPNQRWLRHSHVVTSTSPGRSGKNASRRVVTADNDITAAAACKQMSYTTMQARSICSDPPQRVVSGMNVPQGATWHGQALVWLGLANRPHLQQHSLVMGSWGNTLGRVSVLGAQRDS
jgi:hypothetical protein